MRHVQQVLVLHRIGEAEAGQACLALAEGVAAAAEAEIGVGDDEAVFGVAQHRQPLAGGLVQAVLVQQQAEAGLGAAADASAQLVQLRQAEALRVVDHHDAGFRHIDADFDDGGGDEQADLAGGEIGQGGVTHLRRLLSMRQADRFAEAGAQLGEPCLGGGDVQQFVLVDHRADPVDAAAGIEFSGQSIQHVRHRGQGVQRGADRLAAFGLLGQATDVHFAPVGQQQGAGNGGRGHHQHVGAFALGAQREALVDAEAVLLVDHREGQVVIDDRILEQRVGAHHDRDRAVGESAQQPGALAAFHRSGQHRHRHGAEPRQHAVVLLHQHLGGRHQRGLGAGFHGAQHRHQRDQRLAGADIALQQTQHAPGGDQILVDFGDRLALGARGRVAEAGQGLGAQAAIADQWPADPFARPAADQPQGDLAGEQLVIGQPVAYVWVGQGGRHLHDFQRLIEPRPFLPLQQGRVVPFGEIRQQGQCAAHRHGDLARPEPGGERPDRFDVRQPVRSVGGHHVLGVRNGQPVAVFLDLAGDEQLGAGRRLRLAGELEEHQLGERGAVRDDHLPGLAAVGRRLVADHLHGQRRDLAGLSLGDRRAGAAVEIGFRQVEQQVDHPVSADGARQQRRQGRSYAGEPGQGREKRLQRIILHG